MMTKIQKEKMIKESILKMIKDIKEIDRLVDIYTFIKYYRGSKENKGEE